MNAPLVKNPQSTRGQEVARGLSRRWAAVWVMLITAVAAGFRFAGLGDSDL